MLYIYQQLEWPQFRWDLEKLGVLTANLRQQQGYLLGQMATLGFDRQLEASLETLTSDIIQSSAIEGEVLPYQDVRSSVARKLGMDIGGLSSPNREVEGMVEMMLDATQHYNKPLTVERLFKWHTGLFPNEHNRLGKISVGRWRTLESGPMQVISGPIGRETVHFEAPPADQLDYEIKTFLDWFNEPQEIDPLLKAGIAHLWFITIHPFEDGNGRIARAIADLALARADDSKERFYSMSTQIEKQRKNYYARLESTQKSDLDITLWLKWFVACLGHAIEEANEVLNHVIHKSHVWSRANRFTINDRQRLVINRLLEGFVGNLTSSKYAKLAKCSQDTALRDIRELLNYEILTQSQSGGRSTNYTLAQDMEK